MNINKDEKVEDLIERENIIFTKLEKLNGDFISIEHLFHWRMNFKTGLKNIRRYSKRVSGSKYYNGKKIILEHHRSIRFYCHALLQFPYIIHEHFEKKNPGSVLIKKFYELKKIRSHFESHKVNQLLLRLRHKAVHDILLDEQVSIVEPETGKQYLEIMLPSHVSKTLLAKNHRDKSALGALGKYYTDVFLRNNSGIKKGFIYLFLEYEKILNEFEAEFKKKFSAIFCDKWKLRHSLLIQLGIVRRKMVKQGIQLFE